MMKKKDANIVVNSIDSVVNYLIGLGAYRATKYISPTVVVSAVRRYARKRIDRRAKHVDVVLKIGAPNYEQREFIKKCKKAGETFPVKKIQIKLPQGARK